MINKHIQFTIQKGGRSQICKGADPDDYEINVLTVPAGVNPMGNAPNNDATHVNTSPMATNMSWPTPSFRFPFPQPLQKVSCEIQHYDSPIKFQDIYLSPSMSDGSEFLCLHPQPQLRLCTQTQKRGAGNAAAGHKACTLCGTTRTPQWREGPAGDQLHCRHSAYEHH